MLRAVGVASALVVDDMGPIGAARLRRGSVPDVDRYPPNLRVARATFSPCSATTSGLSDLLTDCRTDEIRHLPSVENPRIGLEVAAPRLEVVDDLTVGDHPQGVVVVDLEVRKIASSEHHETLDVLCGQVSSTRRENSLEHLSVAVVLAQRVEEALSPAPLAGGSTPSRTCPLTCP